MSGLCNRATGLWAAVLAAVVLALGGCRRDDAGVGGGERAEVAGLRVVVTIPPLVGLAERLAPPGSQVRALIPPGRSEHGYELTPTDVAALGQADLIVYVGLQLEPMVERFIIDHPSARRVDLSMAAALEIAVPALAEGSARPADAAGGAGKAGAVNPPHGAPGHVHGPDCDHGPVDPHLWLDPVLVRQFVQPLAASMQTAMGYRGLWNDAARAELESRVAKLEAEIDKIDGEYRERLEPLKDRAIVTHHNAWQRLADRYGLRVAAVIRPMATAEPTPGQIAAAAKSVNEQNVRGIFVEPQFSPGVAERIAREAKVKLGTLDPLGDGDWGAMMRSNLDELARCLAD